MKIKREHSIAGLAVAGILLLVFGLNYLKGLDLLTRRNVYHVVYSDVSGITAATPVYYHGLKVGQVVGTELLDDGSGNVRITFQLNERRLRLTEDAVAELYSADLFSRALRIVNGTSPALIESGATLRGSSQASLTDAVGAQIDPLKAKAEAMLANVDSLLGSLQQLMNPRTVGDIDSSFRSVRDALESISRTARRLDAIVALESGTFSSTLRNMERLSAILAENADELDRTFNNIDTLTTELARGRLKQMLDELAVTSAQLRKVTEGISRGEGTLGKLATNDSLYVNLNNASAELDLLLEDLRVNPNRYFSVFGKKDRLPKLSDSDVQRIKQALSDDKRMKP